MKKAKSILTAAFLACVIGVFAQQTKKTDGPVFKAETTITVDKMTFKPGEKIPLKIVCTYPEDTHQVGSWRLVAYLTDIPGGFEKMPGFEIKPHKDPMSRQNRDTGSNSHRERTRSLKSESIPQTGRRAITG